MDTEKPTLEDFVAWEINGNSLALANDKALRDVIVKLILTNRVGDLLAEDSIVFDAERVDSRDDLL